MSGKGLTVEERKADILKLVDEFNAHLLSPRPVGSILNNRDCVKVAIFAREAVHCSACDEVADDVCLRPNTDIYELMQGMNCAGDTTDVKDVFLINIVHAIVRHQHRLDEQWYKSVLNSIQSLFLTEEEKSMDEETIQVRCHTILCEILSLAVSSNGIHMTFLVLGEDVPKLPSDEEVEAVMKSYSPPGEFNIMSFLSNVRRNTSESLWSPYFIYEDINLESPESKVIGEEFLKYLEKSLGFGPRICMYFALYDCRMMMDVMNVLYVKIEDMANLKAFDYKCAGVSRFHMESVSAGYTSAVSCDYCAQGHTTGKVISGFGVPYLERTKGPVLESFGKVCAKRPIDMDSISKAREEVLSLGGPELVLEASSIVGGFSLMTKVVDATGRIVPTKFKIVMTIVRGIANFVLMFKS